MIVTIGSIYKDAKDLLPHFYRHYSKWGVDRYYWGLYGGQSNPLWEWVAEQSKGLDVVMMKAGEDEVNVLIDQKFKNTTRQLLGENDWYIPVDVDEFHAVRGFTSFHEVANACKKTNSVFVRSEFMDRLAIDGTIPASIDPNISIWEQFPIATRFVTRNIVGGLCTKICLCKPDISIQPGHHYVENDTLTGYEKWGLTHHFKWHGNLREREKRKLIAYLNQNRRYLAEPAILLQYLNLNNDRFVIPENYKEVSPVAP